MYTYVCFCSFVCFLVIFKYTFVFRFCPTVSFACSGYWSNSSHYPLRLATGHFHLLPVRLTTSTFQIFFSSAKDGNCPLPTAPLSEEKFCQLKNTVAFPPCEFSLPLQTSLFGLRSTTLAVGGFQTPQDCVRKFAKRGT